MNIKWDYAKMYANISVPGYVKYTLHQLNNLKPENPQHQPYPAPESTHREDAKNMKPIDTSPTLYAERVKQIMKIVGNLLYCTCGVDNTCPVPLSYMASRSEPTFS